jgi:hypothetical protein
VFCFKISLLMIVENAMVDQCISCWLPWFYLISASWLMQLSTLWFPWAFRLRRRRECLALQP